jgi:hypothetical protein
MVRIEGKKDSLIKYFVFVWSFLIALFMLSGSSNLNQWITTIFYVVLTLVSLAVLAFMPNDEKYYQNLNLPYFLGAVVVGLGMIGLSWGLSLSFKNTDMLMSIAKSPLPGLQSTTLSLTPMATSVFTSFLGVALSGLVFAATSEEFFRLPAFAYGKDKWGKGYKIGNLTIPGVIVYVGLIVGFWSALHGIQAYTSNLIMIFPAFVNGIVLTIYLWRTRCILGAVFGHYAYNLGIVTIGYVSGSSGVSSSLPFLPFFVSNLPLFAICAIIILASTVFLLVKKTKGLGATFGLGALIVLFMFVTFKWSITFVDGYFSNSNFILDILLVVGAIGSFLFFLLPSLTNRKQSQRKR